MSLKIHLTLVKKTDIISSTKGWPPMISKITKITKKTADSSSSWQCIAMLDSLPVRIFFVSFLLVLLLSTASMSEARENVGRMGIGTSNQIATDLPALSFKILNDPTFAIGGLLGVSTSNTGGGHAAGLKIYKIIYDEPQLQFFVSGMGALLKRKTPGNDGSGFQLDFTLGSEFSFQGLESLGFSFEFGVSMNKIDELVIETVGYHFITAAIHFYL